MILARSFFDRFIAVVLFLQGVGPAFLLGVWRPSGWFLASVAVVYTFLAAGFWQRRRWALPVAFALTIPQLVVFSSPWFSWRFFVLASRGFGVIPKTSFATSLFFGYGSSGCCMNVALGYSKPLLADYPGVSQSTFVLFNVLAVPLLALLVILLVSNLYFAAFPPVPNHALQRTEAGDELSSELHI